MLGPVTHAYAAFIVREVHSAASITSLADVDATLAGANIASDITVSRQFIDMVDPDVPTDPGHYSNNQPFPNGLTGFNEDDFAIHATATLIISMAGTYTFGVKSDDGSRLRIDAGSGFLSVINDDSIHGPSDRFGTVYFAAPGLYSLDFVYFDHSGEAMVELFAAFGTLDSFDAARFRLVGDNANGGISTFAATASTVPEPSTWISLGIGLLGLAGYGLRQGAKARA